MLELPLTYDPITRILSIPDRFAGTTLDNLSARLTVEGIPYGWYARLDFRVKAFEERKRAWFYPSIHLDKNRSCILPYELLSLCRRDWKLPLQLVLTKGDVVIASNNILILDVNPSVNSLGSQASNIGPELNNAIVNVENYSGDLTFTRITGEMFEIKLSEDFLTREAGIENAKRFVITDEYGRITVFRLLEDADIEDLVLPARNVEGVLDISNIPPVALERVYSVQTDRERFELTTDQVQNGDTVRVIETMKMFLVVDDTKLDSEDGYAVYTAVSTWENTIGRPDIVNAWSTVLSTFNVPSEKLVKDSLDLKANENEVMHIFGEEFNWNSSIPYREGAASVRNLTLYLSKANDNLGNDPLEPDTVYWQEVSGGVMPTSSILRIIGDGVSTSIDVTHGMNTLHVFPQFIDSEGRYFQTDVKAKNVNEVTVIFHSPPAVNSVRMLISPGAGATE